MTLKSLKGITIPIISYTLLIPENKKTVLISGRQPNLQMVCTQRLENHSESKPQRVKKYLFIWCESGEMEILVDHKLLSIKERQVLTITSGQYHQFKETAGASGYILDFTLDFICKTDKDIELIFQNSLFCHFDYNEVFAIPKHAAKSIQQHLEIIEQELQKKPFQYLESVHSRIELLLIEVNRAKIAGGGEIWKPDALFLQFLELVRNSFDRHPSLEEIAAELHTTTAKLNEQAKLHVGKTAQNVISGLIISEAQRRLQYENKLMKEIAFDLGFNDPYYFSKFFKKHTGLSPSEFEQSLHQKV